MFLWTNTMCTYKILNDSKGFCILVQQVPRLIYHTNKEPLNRLGIPVMGQVRRKSMSTLTLSILLGASLSKLGMETASLITQNQHYFRRHTVIDTDTEWLENSVSHLQKSLTSSAEVMLQNRRCLGPNFSFLQQGALWAALGEKCCFHIDHSGVVKDNMAKVRENKRPIREGLNLGLTVPLGWLL